MKKFRKFGRDHSSKQKKFQVWVIEEEKEWCVLEDGELKPECKTEGEAVEFLQKYIGENFDGKCCAVAMKINGLEGSDKRPVEKMGLLVWIPSDCPARARFVTSSSQAVLAGKMSAKAYNVDDLSEITYADVLANIKAAGKSLVSCDPE